MSNMYKTKKYKYDYYENLHAYYLIGKYNTVQLGEFLGIKSPAMCCILKGCGGLNKERIFKLCKLLDMNIAEWAAKSDYVYARVKDSLPPYINSVVCRLRGIDYDDSYLTAIKKNKLSSVENVS